MNVTNSDRRSEFQAWRQIAVLPLVLLGLHGPVMAEDSDTTLIGTFKAHRSVPAVDSGRPGRMPEFLPRQTAIEQKILEQLDQPTEVTFQDNDLKMAIEHLQDLHGVSIWIDEAQVASEDVKVTLALSQVSLRSCLNLLLEPNGLCFLVEDDVLKVTSQEKADSKFITRTYPVGDLFDNPEEAEELITVLECGLGLTRGEDQPRTLVISSRSRAIVVRQTHRIHDQLLQLLRDLREAPNLEQEEKLSQSTSDVARGDFTDPATSRIVEQPADNLK
jgi:hypothetical protein